MANGEDPQKIKRIAAAAYEYDRDSRWADYWSNVLIPPHMASRSDVVDHFKRKFYHRYIDPDLVVEPMSSSTSSQSTRTSAGSSPPPAPEQSRPRNSGPSVNRTAPSSANGNATANSIPVDKQTIRFSINTWVLLVSILAIFPLMPRNLANKAYRLSLLGSASSSVYSLYIVYGKPRAWNLPSIQTWFQSIIGTKDFIYLVYCLMFVPFPTSYKFALLPLLCRSIQINAKFLRRNFSSASVYRKYFEEICTWVEANVTTISILSSNAEVALGFLLIISLFSPQRNIVQVFIYWQLLKLMYAAPATSGYHRSVWARIGQTVNPYILRYAPFLRTPLSFLQRWWVS